MTSSANEILHFEEDLSVEDITSSISKFKKNWQNKPVVVKQLKY